MNRRDLENFEAWVTDMPEALERFFSAIPTGLRGRLDFSAESLDNLEYWLLETYSTIENFKQEAPTDIFDGTARYVGETFRRRCGGLWDIEQGKRNVYYGMPIVYGATAAAECPHYLITTSLDRRTGTYMRELLESIA